MGVGPVDVLEEDAESLGESRLLAAASGECLRFRSVEDEVEEYLFADNVDDDDIASLAESLLPRSCRRDSC